MGNTSAGNVGDGNDGQTDKGRGSTGKMTYSNSQRNTGKTGSTGTAPNSNTVEGNKRVNKDPRTV